MKAAPGWLENARRMNAAYEAPTTADAEWADGIILGTPTRFGSVTSELKAWIDGLGGLWAKGALNGKAGSAFSSASTAHGGNEGPHLGLSQIGRASCRERVCRVVLIPGGAVYIKKNT